MRKLASIETIHDITPIADADFIELVHILGWQCVAKKGEFSIGDRCVYFEVDAFLPVDDRFEFLRKSSYRENEYCGNGFRVKTQKMRGEISQGVALPISIFPEIKNSEIGDDVSEILGVKKWEVPEVQGSLGLIVGNKPLGIPTTDETRVQSVDALRRQLLGKKYYISTKMDGTSVTMYYIGGEFGVCSRENAIADDETSSVWKYAHNNDIISKIKSLNRDIVFQGEFCGHGIQKNRLNLMKPEWYVFNVIDANGMKLLSFDDFISITESLGITHVPIEEVGENFNYTLEELLEKARGKYPSGKDKEGIVVRPTEPIYCKELCKELSFKVLNNDFLAKEK